MKIIEYPSKDLWNEILKRPEIDNSLLKKQVSKILGDVKKNGDKALRKYSRKFDQISIRNLKVQPKEFKLAEKKLTEELKSAIRVAYDNIRKFHESQVEHSTVIETIPGVKCWRKSIPISRVGLYIPGGSAPLFSTILMLGIPADIAGCKDVVLCTPPAKDGTIHPAILFAAQLVGISDVFKCGGAQAIAALAYGTSTIGKVDKIFGPGNQYVTSAKQLVQMDGVSIDMPAGPSEVCIYADSTSNPHFVASDLLSQAEHGPDSQVLLVSTDLFILKKVSESLESQLARLNRMGIAQSALENSKMILVQDKITAMDLINSYAPEHLILSVDEHDFLAEKVENAGSVFLGHYTPESAGDYASGTNHTLPTNGYARAYSGVSVDSFIKKVTFQEITEKGINNLGNTIIEMASAEGLDAHANAVRLRMNPKNNEHV